MNTLIVVSAALVINAQVANPTPNYGLRLVREVVEHALGREESDRASWTPSRDTATPYDGRR